MYVRTHIHTYIHTYVYTYVHANMLVCVCVCVCVFNVFCSDMVLCAVCMCRVCVCARTCVCVCACVWLGVRSQSTWRWVSTRTASSPWAYIIFSITFFWPRMPIVWKVQCKEGMCGANHIKHTHTHTRAWPLNSSKTPSNPYLNPECGAKGATGKQREAGSSDCVLSIL